MKSQVSRGLEIAWETLRQKTIKLVDGIEDNDVLANQFMPFLFGSSLIIMFWDMLGIYNALSFHREYVPEPFPLLGFGYASTNWFWGQLAMLLAILIVCSVYLHFKKAWVIGSTACIKRSS